MKNQGNCGCGSCYAFSATGALEAQHFLKTGKLLSLSEQNIVDCSSRNGNAGCNRGWIQRSLIYIQFNGGINFEKTYPYKAKKQVYNPEDRAATVTGYEMLKRGSEKQLTEAIAEIGPIAVAVYVVKTFRHYKRGIYYGQERVPGTLLQAVLVVGYGSEDGHDYYIVNNSWGERWGDGGYIKMSRNRGNNCGIASYPTYPTV